MTSPVRGNDDACNHGDNSDWNEVINILQIQKLPHHIEPSDVEGKELNSWSDWKNFYDLYAKWMGFSVRMEHVRKNSNDVEWQRLFVCSREGFRRKKWVELPNRKKQPKAVTRVGCKAALKVILNKHSGQWIAIGFQHCHNHDLASPSEIQFLRSHRAVPPSVVEQAKAMRRVWIRTMSILDFIAQQFGGRHKLPFLKTDLYNKLSNDRRDVGAETDCEGALGYLTCLAVRDENFFCRFNVDDENRLHTIFWEDGTSRRYFELFGDVLAFDTTYRSNAYNKPLLLMVGVNNHYRTTVFVVALLADETTSTFLWVLEQFVACMNNKKPGVVLTDGDHAMRSAIIQTFGSSIHRLCSWHLGNNAGANVPNNNFKIQFSKLMYHYYTPSEFEDNWRSLIEEHDLEHSDWASSLYEKRFSWAETFLRGNFFAGMRTTQRCESMNAYMRRFLDSKHLLHDFVSQVDHGVQTLRHSEMQDDFTTKHTDPLFPQRDPLLSYYKQVASICTRNIYHLISNQIQAQNAFSVNAIDYVDGRRIFTLSKFPSGEVRYRVHYDSSTGNLGCSCLLFETDGIPCRHIFATMKHLTIEVIPANLFRPCWRKDIKLTVDFQPDLRNGLPQGVLESTRMATLASEFHSLGFYASKFDDTFADARNHLHQLTEKFKLIFSNRQEQTNTAGNSSVRFNNKYH